MSPDPVWNKRGEAYARLITFRTRRSAQGGSRAGAATERGEDTLDVPEHSNRLSKGNGYYDFVRNGSVLASTEEQFTGESGRVRFTRPF